MYWVGIGKFLKNLPEGEADLTNALAILDGGTNTDGQLRSWILGDLGFYKLRRGDAHGAVPLYRQSLEIRKRIYHEGHPDLVMGLNNLGNALQSAGEFQEARILLQSALDADQRRLGSDHPHVGLILASLGDLERRAGNFDRARSHLNRSLEILDNANLAPFDSGYSGAVTALGRLAETQGRVDDALRYLRRAYEIFRHEPGISDSDPSPDYARVLRKAGRVAEAEKVEVAMSAASTK